MVAGAAADMSGFRAGTNDPLFAQSVNQPDGTSQNSRSIDPVERHTATALYLLNEKGAQCVHTGHPGLAAVAGLEPATTRLTVGCSLPLRLYRRQSPPLARSRRLLAVHPSSGQGTALPLVSLCARTGALPCLLRRALPY
jgi:hypothetical protein